MLADDPSHESPHQAWLAYLDRMSTPDVSLQVGSLQVGESAEWRSSLDQPGSGQPLSTELLDEEEFCTMLALLDDLCIREIEGQLSIDLREQMDKLRLVLLGELDEADEDFALLPEATPGPTALQGGSPRKSPQETSGARNRRHLWRQSRRGPQ